MATTLTIAFTLGYKTYCLLVFYSSFTGIFYSIILYGSIYLLPSCHVISKEVYVTIAKLACVIIG